MLNNFGGNNDLNKLGAYQLVVIFNSEDELKKAYSVMQKGSTIISPMQETEFSPCFIKFFDKFVVRWGFMI